MASVACPYCGEDVEVWVEPGEVQHQQFVEDCAVCCRPILLSLTYDYDTEDVHVVAEREAG